MRATISPKNCEMYKVYLSHDFYIVTECQQADVASWASLSALKKEKCEWARNKHLNAWIRRICCRYLGVLHESVSEPFFWINNNFIPYSDLECRWLACRNLFDWAQAFYRVPVLFASSPYKTQMQISLGWRTYQRGYCNLDNSVAQMRYMKVVGEPATLCRVVDKCC